MAKTEKAPRMGRDEIKAAVKRGEHVAVGAAVYRKDPVSGRLAEPLPPPPPADSDADDDFEAVVVRTADGRLNRVGMEHALKHGGSVMYKGAVITSHDDLPDEAQLAADAEADEKAVADSYDSQIARLQAQKQEALARAKNAPVQAKPRRTRKAPAAERPAHADTREDWNRYAKKCGVENAEDLGTKEDVIAACDAAAPADDGE